ncbi:hypothetical protein [Candidatus Nitrosocosmicus hydrocola]|uniref:hypothetical protein n=1 Tax=Candidatus Nitrosocosmicus hydrocola TaxID=1826872 RepID=UPI0011E5A8B5|nr:hypothetical protein [Candidatus Nitrosocosmicus hydrocola]
MIDFDICEQLKPIVSEMGYDSHGIIKLNFTEAYDNLSLIAIFNITNIQKSLNDFEKKVRKIVPNISTHHFNLLEDTIYKNIGKLLELNVSDTSNKQSQTIKFLRKLEHNSVLYEAIILDKLPKFVSFNNSTFALIDKIEIANYLVHPADTIITQNPMPYSFESEQELCEYLDMVKKETRDSLFEKILAEFRRYLNTEDHTLVILAADIFQSYFQNKFGTTHYNIFVGENGSGKNSALLVIRMLGYRPFYVTSASPANYYTFLGDVQEGQGIILEDEADNIGIVVDKKNILKTGYCSGGSVPKVGFTKDGHRYQESYLTFCFKCFAMEELPGDKYNKGIFDRSFIHHFFKGDVPYNIKDIINDKGSDLYKSLIHLRKLLIAFKLANYEMKLPEIKTNLAARDAELTYPLLRMFHGCRNFEKVRKALSTMIYEKTMKKSNSIEAKIAETLFKLGNNENNMMYNFIDFTNKEFEDMFIEIAEARDNPFDVLRSTLYFSDGTKITKYQLSNLLRSKFNAKPYRTNRVRGYSVIRTDVEKVSKQYEVVEDIMIYEDNNTSKKVTEVTQVTESKDISLTSGILSDVGTSKSNNENKSNLYTSNPTSRLDNNTSQSIQDVNNHRTNEYESIRENSQSLACPDIKNYHTHSHSVTSVTCVTAAPPQYPCYFCGDNYKTNIDFDMGNHFLEKHKDQLNNYPMSGNRERKIERILAETKHRLSENNSKADNEEKADED